MSAITTTSMEEVIRSMKKLMRWLIECLKEGLPLGKSVIEFYILTMPFFRNRSGRCPLCDAALWDRGAPSNAFQLLEDHVKYCPKGASQKK